jgi:hypothetical protein
LYAVQKTVYPTGSEVKGANGTDVRIVYARPQDPGNRIGPRKSVVRGGGAGVVLGVRPNGRAGLRARRRRSERGGQRRGEENPGHGGDWWEPDRGNGRAGRAVRLGQRGAERPVAVAMRRATAGHRPARWAADHCSEQQPPESSQADSDSPSPERR